MKRKIVLEKRVEIIVEAENDEQICDWVCSHSTDEAIAELKMKNCKYDVYEYDAVDFVDDGVEVGMRL